MIVVIPAAGSGQRFINAGYTVPKPFIQVLGKPMISHVIEMFMEPSVEIGLLIRQDALDYAEQLRDYGAYTRVVPRLTEGTACTVLEAYDWINNDRELIIANSDQVVDTGVREMVNQARQKNLDGNILCFRSSDPKWSYVELRDDLVQRVVEKEVISDTATVGIYYFKHGSDFVNAAEQMILADDRVKNEFYTAPTYNYLIKAGKKIGITLIQEDQMHGLGTPEDLKEYIKWKSEN